MDFVDCTHAIQYRELVYSHEAPFIVETPKSNNKFLQQFRSSVSSVIVSPSMVLPLMFEAAIGPRADLPEIEIQCETQMQHIPVPRSMKLCTRHSSLTHTRGKAQLQVSTVLHPQTWTGDWRIETGRLDQDSYCTIQECFASVFSPCCGIRIAGIAKSSGLLQSRVKGAI